MATTAGTRVEVRLEARHGKNESSTALIRRFTRRAKGLGIVRAVRGSRYWERSKSKNIIRKRAVVAKVRRENYNEQVKLGKIDPMERRNTRRR